MLKTSVDVVDRLSMERELTTGWKNTTGRRVLQVFGWLLLVAGSGAVIVGLVTGPPALSAAGFVAALAAWWISGALPEPAPAPTRGAARRIAVLEKLSDHQLPV
ncbi:MAG: hypothetical protein KJN71_04715 [Acidimicrobiia bacterium]|nr:hypothetical protein [Acidimicrobiia bacterium]NNC76288.1 hypothetical protein [Acidimicrobiia bacterium]